MDRQVRRQTTRAIAEDRMSRWSRTARSLSLSSSLARTHTVREIPLKSNRQRAGNAHPSLRSLRVYDLLRTPFSRLI